MALGRYTRIDGHSSSNYCLVISLVVFVSTCLIGAWMTMSSSVGPAGMGVTLELFMSGMPKKVSHSEAFLTEDSLKANASRGNLQDVNSPISLVDINVPEAPLPAAEKNPDSKQIGQIGTPVKESGSHEDKAPAEKEKKLLSGDDSQAEKADLEQNNDPTGDPSGKTSGSGSKKDKPNGNSPNLEASPTLSAGSEKDKVPEKLLPKHQHNYRWKVCYATAGPDYIPCLDNIKAIRNLHGISHYQHLERHCPDEAPTCLVPLPKGYRTPVRWPKSRDMIWFVNVPHTRLAEYKKDQNWVRVNGRYSTFPGGGTQFKHGALHYIDFIQKTLPDIAWGKRSRVVLDVGCGVASFGGYLFERGVLTMSLAPKDVHEAQVQFALERGIPAILAVMGSKRLPFPSMVFDIVHCARCRVPWHLEGGRLLLELNRVLRPGGYFVWSATPVYRKGAEDVSIWKDMSKLTKSMCWELVKVGKDQLNGVSAAIFRKPTVNNCYETRPKNDPPLCEESDDPNSAWYTPLKPCIHKVPTDPSVRGSQWPTRWPSRLDKYPYWLKVDDNGIAPKDLSADNLHWRNVITNSYLNGIGIDWSVVRNVMDMKASYGGFAAALKDLQLWVMNVIPVNSSDTLPLIYERGLIGLYHDWCESFNTYPRSYDLLHADNLFSDLKKRCNFVAVMAEVDRILRPGGKLIVRDDSESVSDVKNIAKTLHWTVKFFHSDDHTALLCVEKSFWRPLEVERIAAAIA